MRSININDARYLKSYRLNDNIYPNSYYGRKSSVNITVKLYRNIKIGLATHKNQ